MSVPVRPKPIRPIALYQIYQVDSESGEWMLLMTVCDRATMEKSMEFYGMGHTLFCAEYRLVNPR